MSDAVGDVVGHLGSRIRAEREAQGLTVAEVSARGGVGRSTVSDVENGARRPTLETLAKIARGLGVPMPALFDERLAAPPIAALDDVEGLDARLLSSWREAGRQVEVYRVTLTGTVRRGRGAPGSRGYVTVASGTVSAGTAATPRRLSSGDQLAYAADQPHLLSAISGPAELVLVMRYPVPDQDSAS